MKKYLSDRFVNYLKSNSIQNVYPGNSEEIIIKWRNKLFEGISKQEQKKYSLERYPWHLFSFNLKSSYDGTLAISRYQSQFFKSYYLIIYQESTAIFCNSNMCIPYHDLIAIRSNIKKHDDIYITHQNFKWTFVIPHEKNLGPYLYSE